MHACMYVLCVCVCVFVCVDIYMAETCYVSRAVTLCRYECMYACMYKYVYACMEVNRHVSQPTGETYPFEKPPRKIQYIYIYIYIYIYTYNIAGGQIDSASHK